MSMYMIHVYLYRHRRILSNYCNVGKGGYTWATGIHEYQKQLGVKDIHPKTVWYFLLVWDIADVVLLFWWCFMPMFGDVLRPVTCWSCWNLANPPFQWAERQPFQRWRLRWMLGSRGHPVPSLDPGPTPTDPNGPGLPTTPTVPSLAYRIFWKGVNSSSKWKPLDHVESLGRQSLQNEGKRRNRALLIWMGVITCTASSS